MKQYITIFILILLTGTTESLWGQCNLLVWEDNFDGIELDTSKWSFQIGNGCPDLCGWGNGELEYYTDRNENVKLQGGNLVLTARQETYMGSGYTSGRIRTLNKGDWTTGRFEARIKMPEGQGIWPALWMLPTENYYGGWPLSGEIDIVELIGQEPNRAHGTLHYGPLSPVNQQSGNTFDLLSGSFSDSFHVFAMEWDREEIRWYIDDILYSTRNPESLGKNPWRFDRPFYLLLNIAVGGYWPGDPDFSTSFPQTMEVDYIRVYQDIAKTIISGRDHILRNSKGQNYLAADFPGADYDWTVPLGATITSGQGTNEIEVDWGGSGGDVTVEITLDTCSELISLPVELLMIDCSDTIEDFEGNQLMYWIGTDGDYIDTTTNPAPNEINSSAICAQYERNPAVQYSSLRYTPDFISDASLFVDNTFAFEVDVYTDAPEGTEILIQLEDQLGATQPYPAGRQSIYEAYTSKRNEWERLRFDLRSTPDFFTGDDEITQFLLLFAPNSFTNYTFYVDNFRMVDPSCITSVNEVINLENEVEILPNPFTETLQISYNGSEGLNIEIFNINMRKVAGFTEVRSNIDLGYLADGTYLVRITASDQTIIRKIIKSTP